MRSAFQPLRSSTLINEAPSHFSFILTFARPYPLFYLSFLTCIPLFDREAPDCRLGRWRGKGNPTQLDDNNKYVLSGILDWEYSGFYPDYYESVRCTNCLGPYEEDDWYLFLPECVSPKFYAQRWLLDRVRETRVV